MLQPLLNQKRQTHAVELLLCALGGVTIGLDTAQVAGVVALRQAEEMGVEVTPFHSLVPFGTRTVELRAPKALLLKNHPGRALLIESPTDIVNADLAAIHALPPALAACNPVKSIWGIAVLGGTVMILIDLDKLANSPGWGAEQKPVLREAGTL